MSNSFSFIVPGIPVGKERPRKGKHGFYTPKKTKDYEELVGFYAKKSLMDEKINTPHFNWRMDGKYILTIWIFGEFKSDLDNVAKSIMDGLNKIAYNDDKLVYSLIIEKRSSPSLKEVRVWVMDET